MKEDRNEDLPDMNSPTDEKGGYPGVLKPDTEKYLPFVESFDMTDAQKIELLRTLWNIMSAFVDLGWDVNSLPEFLPALHEISGDKNHNKLEVCKENCAEVFNASVAFKEEENDGAKD